MATVVITFFLFVRFYVCKMDADCIGNQRDHYLSRREKRWSMNSQRLEEIVALLMAPISNDARRYFDTDLNALLEEYLTEAGLHALDAGDDADAAAVVAPNYAELALLLQQSAAIYGRKVDFLYQHVLDVSEALHASSLFDDVVEATPAEEEGAEARTPRAGARASARVEQFARTGSQRGGRVAREPGAARPHPTLPRTFVELEPRVMAEARRPLRDYSGEPIGLYTDYQASFELPHCRMLVEDESAQPVDGEVELLRPISLVELQQAIEAAAPPLPEPLSPASSLTLPCSPLRCSTPLAAASPLAGASPDGSAVLTPSPLMRQRKRPHSANNIESVEHPSVKIILTEELRRRLAETREFSIPHRWVQRRVTIRKGDILSSRWQLRELEPSPSEEFPGWSAAEATDASLRVAGRLSAESDDDGFFEQSSVGECESRGPDWCSWQAGVVARATAAERRGGVDVRALGAAVLRGLPPPPAAEHCDALLRRAAPEPTQVSHVLLSTLFLANAGNVLIMPGAPLSLNSFRVQLLDRELRAPAVPADPAHDPA
ncbi:hypothetical protein PYW07_003019 [Mythimna separata]|uniref:Condensin II complex subunit H2 N-terminal domain-containing protein n=1 Tax=Mythimna separata TaxID=271217 RepID=A0AAD7YHB6_MYTSE|nr:hypothetical protein PYW07_003019 [Mythimna separata]